MSRKYPQADVKVLYGLAAARCAFPNCRRELVLEGTTCDKTKQIGKIAHIVAHSKNGPRSDSNYPKAKLDTYENWVLLCPTCHDIVDVQEGKYSVEYLQQLKTDHETWVQESLTETMAQISFAELEVATKGISSLQPPGSSNEFSVITPDEKIHKNRLSNATRQLIAMGLMQAQQVKAYLGQVEQVDPGFILRLIGGFQEKYKMLTQSDELTTDAVFEELLNYASSNGGDFKTRAAGLALLSHLFETCEVFEK